MRDFTKVLLLAGAVIAGHCLSAGTASAAIKCQKGFQLVAGNYISTPYCRDNYVAKVAGEYGMKASAEQVRNNPHYKRNVCRLIGRDIRISDACAEVNPWDRGGRF